MKIALGCILKMEELYICEWIEHYKKLGFSHIFIADNNYSGYKYPLQPVIQSYIDEGYVTLYNYNDLEDPEHGTIQCLVYTDIYNKVKNEYDWIAFLDIDEFLELPQNNNISEFILRPEFKEFNVINIPWLRYDSNNQFYYKPGPVQERFPTPSHDKCIRMKSIIKCMDGVNKIASAHDPIDSKNNTVKFNRCNPLGQHRERNKQHGPDFNDDEIQYITDFLSVAHIKHYWCKSFEEYLLYRTARGDVSYDKSKHKDVYRYCVESFFGFDNMFMINDVNTINDIINNISNTDLFQESIKYIHA